MPAIGMGTAQRARLSAGYGAPRLRDTREEARAAKHPRRLATLVPRRCGAVCTKAMSVESVLRSRGRDRESERDGSLVRPLARVKPRAPGT